MQIETITCHDVYNHGATLQAYALQRYLTEQGHDVQIIDYKPWYLSNHYKLSSINNPIFDRLIIRDLYILAKLPGRLIALRRKRAFDRFKKEHLKLTPQRFVSNLELGDNCPDADVYIAGSDQIWNTMFQNGRDAAFYLDFVPAGKKRVSYAASFATDKIESGYEEFVKSMINRFDHISVREQTGVRLLREMGINRAVQVCDPVFLLDKKAWSEITSSDFKEKYLLVYDTENSTTIKNIARAVAHRLKLKIWSIGSFRLNYADRNYYLSGPKEFVSLIKNAGFVISNSFHATAFSLIFEKNMCVVNRGEAINSRMHSLLDSLGISNRLAGADFNVEDLAENIDYVKVNELMEKTISSSKQYLKESIG